MYNYCTDIQVMVQLEGVIQLLSNLEQLAGSDATIWLFIWCDMVENWIHKAKLFDLIHLLPLPLIPLAPPLIRPMRSITITTINLSTIWDRRDQVNRFNSSNNNKNIDGIVCSQTCYIQQQFDTKVYTNEREELSKNKYNDVINK